MIYGISIFIYFLLLRDWFSKQHLRWKNLPRFLFLFGDIFLQNHSGTWCWDVLATSGWRRMNMLETSWDHQTGDIQFWKTEGSLSYIDIYCSFAEYPFTNWQMSGCLLNLTQWPKTMTLFTARQKYTQKKTKKKWSKSSEQLGPQCESQGTAHGYGVWGFPMEDPNSWMFYHGKSHSKNGWFRGTPHLGKPHVILYNICIYIYILYIYI